jgi:four helix bundle protein
MATIKRFEDLEIWQLAKELENLIFLETQKIPLSKDYKLKDQMNASTGSIMDNIAEGFGRGGRLEFLQFLSISRGSGNELQSQLYHSKDRNYFTKETFDVLIVRTDILCRKISAMMEYLNQSSVKAKSLLTEK